MWRKKRLRTSKVRVRVSARSISLIGLIIVGLSRVAATQSLVSAEDLPAAIRLLDNAPAHKSLPCTISADKWPRLDFLLRYTFGFGVDCRLGEIQPGEKLIAIVRVKPTKDAPAVMVEEFDVPPFPPEQLTGFYAKKLSDVRISMSGGFAVGVGRYSAEVVLTDEHGHTCRKRWSFSAGNKKQARILPLTLRQNRVAPLLDRMWNGKLKENGVRLTVLFQAAPVYADSARLYEWERTYLLESLTGLLDQFPCRSVRLVAFNLDRQEVLVRQEDFDASGFIKLAKSLEQLELAAIPYQALEPQARQEFLLRLVQEEVSAKDLSEVVIFLGPASHLTEKLPQEMLRHIEGSDAAFSYLEFFRGTHADGVERLTKYLHGQVFEISTPEDLGRAITRILAKIKPIESGYTPSLTCEKDQCQPPSGSGRNSPLDSD